MVLKGSCKATLWFMCLSLVGLAWKLLVQVNHHDIQGATITTSDAESSYGFVVAKEMEKTTVVLMTYAGSKRMANLEMLVHVYETYPIVDRIVLVANGFQLQLNLTSTNEKLVTVVFEENSMNNRFDVYNFIRTRSVLIVDDDVLLEEPLIERMVNAFVRDPKRLFGLDVRYTFDNKYSWSYLRKALTAPGTLVLGKTMLFAATYLEKFMAHKEMVSWIAPPKPHFCEDIAMNALISNYTNQGPVFIAQESGCRRKILDDAGGLSAKSKAWIKKRHECVKWLNKYFHQPFRISTEMIPANNSPKSFRIFSEPQFVAFSKSPKLKNDKAIIAYKHIHD